MADGVEDQGGNYESRAEAFKDGASTHAYWTNAIALAGTDEKTWRKNAETAIKIYEADNRPAFNILFSNTETIKAAVYNSLPVPDIRTRNGDRNEPARKGAALIERAVNYGMDEYDFDDTLRATVHELSLAGRGVGWVEYEPLMRTVQIEDDQGQPIVGPDGKPQLPPKMGPDGKPMTRDQIVWQSAKCRRIPYDKFRHGPADQWGDVPWVARLKGYTRDELRKIPGIDPAVADKVPLDMTDGDPGEDKPTAQRDAFKKAAGWEVWDKDTRQVFIIAPGHSDGPLAVIPDPLALLDFFPCPRPLIAIRKNGSLCPSTPYDIYSKQAEELNTVSERIIALIGILKYRGVRAAEVKEIEQVTNLDDGEFVASEGALAVLAQQKSLSDAIWVMPIDKIVAVVRELVVQRAEIKQAIYEITGIADIMRGASSPSETYGAQQIKAQWGSLRVQDMQRDIQRFVRDIIRLKSEIIASKYTAETLGVLNNGEPVAPEVMQILRDDVRRSYTIDIETDSTIRGDLQRSQQNMGMFLQGTAQFAQSIGPLVATPNNPAGVIPPQIALAVYSSFARQFKLGKEVEDLMAQHIEQAAQTGGQAPPDPEAEAKAKEAEELSRAGAIANVKGAELDNAKKEGEVKGQEIENTRQMLAPIDQPASGFIQ